MLTTALLYLVAVSRVQSIFPPYNLENTSELFGSRSPYCVAQGNDVHLLQNHEIIQIFGLFRHGTRNPAKYEIEYMKILDTIKTKIGPRATISQSDKESIENWKNVYEDSKLVEQGRTDMKDLGTRMRENFKSIFSEKFNSEEYKVLSSPKQRALESAVHFLRSAFGNTSFNENNIPRWSDNDVTLNIDKIKGNTTRSRKIEFNKFKDSIEMKATLKRVTEVLDYETEFTFEDVKWMYEACRLDYTRDLEKARQSKPAWCTIFTEEDFKNFAYLEDLNWDGKFGYRSRYGDKLGCPLIMQIKSNFESAMLKPRIKALLNFGHRSNIFPTFTMLGLGYDKVPLTAANMDKMSNRNWRTSFLNPFASNILLVLSKLDKDFYVSVFVNEHIVPLTIESNETCTICKWSQFEKKINNYIEKHDKEQFEDTGCNFGYEIPLP